MESIRIIMNECTMPDKRVQILLSTYNGECYLREQIESFLTLDRYEQIKVMIRDDGSTDNTVMILKEYEKKSNFNIVYGENLGITGSYMWLLKHYDKECDYFAFSDQDDIWLPDKIAIALDLLDGEQQNKPLLFASLSHIVDEKLNSLGSSRLPVRGISYYNAMIQNVLPGHTQVINKALLEIVLDKGCTDVHVIDWWYYLAASAVGEILFYPEFTVLHRQHGDNAVGVEKNPVKNLVKRLKYIKDGRGNAFSKQLNSFYTRYDDMMPEEFRIETEMFFSSMRSFFMRVYYVLHCKVYRQSPIENLLFKTLYILGKYNV